MEADQEDVRREEQAGRRAGRQAGLSQTFRLQTAGATTEGQATGGLT